MPTPIPTLSGWELAVAVFQILAAIATIGGLAFIAYQSKIIAKQLRTSMEGLRFSKEEKLRTNTDRIIDMYNDETLSNHIIRAMDFIRKDARPTEKFQEYKDDAILRRSVILTFNYYERVAKAYNDEQVVKEDIVNMLGGSCRDYYDKSKWLIDALKKEHPDAPILDHWHRMYIDLNKN